ncbi:hypothetical protein BDP55DRAFT_301605 [Colletotrichum godetiae]|uniref:Uncharacterized protein n=1 Tax=Colletotrichum godetiae TaxID=1209918 RepID=A0AAJ0AW12_9PEZI|nr:uncharacterized protein BDP55DRAFT_301605 [Colletotrichum godetiae]KAK1690632.1 hypothetical protein BDP55DRAFT_301605 [Colletotrichum godetiae]
MFAALLLRIDLIDDDALVSSSVNQCRPITENSEIPALRRHVVGPPGGGFAGSLCKDFLPSRMLLASFTCACPSSRPAKDTSPGRRHCRWALLGSALTQPVPPIKSAARSKHGGPSVESWMGDGSCTNSLTLHSIVLSDIKSSFYSVGGSPPISLWIRSIHLQPLFRPRLSRRSIHLRSPSRLIFGVLPAPSHCCRESVRLARIPPRKRHAAAASLASFSHSLIRTLTAPPPSLPPPAFPRSALGL